MGGKTSSLTIALNSQSWRRLPHSSDSSLANDSFGEPVRTPEWNVEPLYG